MKRSLKFLLCIVLLSRCSDQNINDQYSVREAVIEEFVTREIIQFEYTLKDIRSTFLVNRKLDTFQYESKSTPQLLIFLSTNMCTPCLDYNEERILNFLGEIDRREDVMVFYSGLSFKYLLKNTKWSRFPDLLFLDMINAPHDIENLQTPTYLLVSQGLIVDAFVSPKINMITVDTYLQRLQEHFMKIGY